MNVQRNGKLYINLDDENSKEVLEYASYNRQDLEKVTFGIENGEAEYQARDIEYVENSEYILKFTPYKNGVKMGEGWLLTAEMLEFIEMGVKNIVCAQPFGCLPNHIIAKGMIRKIKDNHPEANIIAVDYDPGASSVNQENRIRLMLENARMLATE